MATTLKNLDDIGKRLEILARQHKVPGASLAVLAGDELLDWSTGVTSLNTGVGVTPETLFQIGSNTKVYTATLVMQLVDEGTVDLDAPVRRYMPGLKLGDAKALSQVTVRMILTHTSGIEGDYFKAFGRGDAGVAEYVDSLGDIGNVHTPGSQWSYSNTSFVLAGRLLEVVTGQTYADLLKERIFKPLGLHSTTVLAEEMLAFRYAIGHVVPPGMHDPVVAPIALMPYSSAPAGSVTSATARDVLSFVRMHFEGGRAPDGSAVLSAASVRAMQEPQAKLPVSSLGEAMGIGWILSNWSGERVIGHGGGTIGQLSFLQALPDRGIAVCLLTNSATGGSLWRDLSRQLFDELAGVQTPSVPKPPVEPLKVDLERFAGTYRKYGTDTVLRVEDGKLIAAVTATGELAAFAPPQELVLVPLSDDTFYVSMAGTETVVQFLEFDRAGRPSYVHFGGRSSRRVGASGKASKASKPAKSKPKAKASTKRPASKKKGSRKR
jgi:CubicO group peptidase (beta-lactamase class C family)